MGYLYSNSYCVPRLPLSDDEREWGRRLAGILRDRRGVVGVSAEALAVTAGVSVETVPRIERGLVPSPGFFTVAVVARVLELNPDDGLAPGVDGDSPRGPERSELARALDP